MAEIIIISFNIIAVLVLVGFDIRRLVKKRPAVTPDTHNCLCQHSFVYHRQGGTGSGCQKPSCACQIFIGTKPPEIALAEYEKGEAKPRTTLLPSNVVTDASQLTLEAFNREIRGLQDVIRRSTRAVAYEHPIRVLPWMYEEK